MDSENTSFSMPVAPAYGGYGMNGGGFGFGGDWSWILLLVLLCGGGWGGMGFGGFGGGFGGMYEFPWLLNGQSMINANTNAGFNQAATQAALGDLSNAITSGFGNVQTALCGGFAGVNATVNGAQNAIAQQLYTNQIADLERSFASQTAVTGGLTNLSSQFAQCCCDNRLATCQTQNVIGTEAAATRSAIQGGIQTVLDKLCALELDGYKRENDQLRSQVNELSRQASQNAQTAELRQSGATQLNQLVSELRSCPIPAQPVYGSQPIFTCSGNGGCGCGAI